MKKRITSFGIAGIALLLCALTVFGVVAPASAAAVSSLDYSIAGRENNTVLSAVELYELLFDTAPTEAEAAYLQTTGITMSYNSLIPVSQISYDYNSDEGRLSVTIRPYTYTAANGQTVTWVPAKAVIDGREVSMVTEEDGSRMAVVEGLFYTENFDMQVEYAWGVEVPKDVIHTLRHEAYASGQEGIATEQAYEEYVIAYNAAVKAHEAWVAYQTWEEEYKIYCDAMDIYQPKKDAYDHYINVELPAYKYDMECFRVWKDYSAYLKYVTENAEAYNAYKTYCKQMDAMRSKIRLLESTFIRDSRGWQLYGDIMGGMVDFVLSKKKELVEIGKCNPDDIKLAGDSTEALRKLLTEYKALRDKTYADEYQQLAALYGFYAENYVALKENFSGLCSALYALAQFSPVYHLAKEQGRLEHFMQLIGQLYVISSCLDSSQNLDPNWTIYGEKLTKVVEPCQMLTDKGVDWNPANTKIPEKKVEEVYWPEEQKEPTVPKVVQEPEMPDPVADPGKGPDFVANPYETVAPPEVAHPGKMDPAPVFDAVTAALMKEIKDGVLKPYTGEVEAQSLQFSTSVTRPISIENKKMVFFYHYDGSLLWSTELNYGDNINYPLPVREDTVEYRYRPLGWVKMDGSSVDLVEVTEDLSLYPLYEIAKQTYTVTWILDGVSYASRWSYGSLPVPNAEMPLYVPDSQYYRYVFSGWDHEVVPVTGNVVYEGSVKKVPKEFKITWVLLNGTESIEEQWAYGTTPSYAEESSRLTDKYLYEFIGWDKNPSPVKGDAVYTAQYKVTPLAMGGMNSPLEVVEGEERITVQATHPSVDVRLIASIAKEAGKALSVEWDNGASLLLPADQLEGFLSDGVARVLLQAVTDGQALRYDVYFYNSVLQQMSALSFDIELTLPNAKVNDSIPVFYTVEEGERVMQDNNVLTLRGSISVYRLYSYRTTMKPNDYVAESFANRAVEGDVVSLALGAYPGYEVTGAIVIDENGASIPVNDLCFVMPSSAVTIELITSKIEYRITYTVNGKVYDSFTLEWGKEIPLPEKEPTMEAEEGYIYNFVKWIWGEEDVPAFATGSQRELVFEAVFEKAAEKAVFDTMNNNNILFEVILPCVLVGIVVLVAGLITLIVLRKRARKKKLAAAAAVEEAEVLTSQQEAEEASPDADPQEESEQEAETTEDTEDKTDEMIEESKQEIFNELDQE